MLPIRYIPQVLQKMGNTCHTADQNSSSFRLNNFTSDRAQLTGQDFDNPHREQLSSKFLQTHFDASNHLMEMITIPRKGSRQLSAFWNDTIVESQGVERVEFASGGSLRSKGRSLEALPCVKICYGDFVDISKKKIEEKYRIIEKIGTGTYGQVFKAQHQSSGQIRAIKIFKRNEIQKHREQIEILKLCDHPNIIQIYEVFQQERSWHVVMEYCEGGSIVNLIKSKKYEYLELEAQTILEQILHALNYLHNKGIVHRDIKLENVVFVKPAPGELPTSNLKIIDFGTAQRLKFKVNKSKIMGGTTVYMPPEAFSGWYSCAFDIWSCGVMLCILLTGTCPFKRSTKDDTIEAILNSEIDFTDAKWIKVSEEVKDLIKRMLIKDFTKRPTAEECLKSSWFRSCMKRSQLRKASQKFTTNLTKYYAINNFVSLVESYLSFLKISHSQKNEIKRLFQALDVRREGRLNKEDLLEMYKTCLGTEKQQGIRLLLSAIDKNKSGFIDYSQFQALMSDRQKLFIGQSLSTAFDYFDVDGSGFIEKNQLVTCLKDCQADVQELITDIDKDQDDRISKQEFVGYFEKIQTRLMEFQFAG